MGKKNGQLSGWHPAALCAKICDAVVDRTGIDGALIDDVIVGCVSAIGAQAGNIGRNTVLSAEKIPESVPGCTVDRQCGSSLQAQQFAIQAVMSGTQDVVLAAGVEVMSLVPIGSNMIAGMKEGYGNPMNAETYAKYQHSLQNEFAEFGINTSFFSQMGGAEMLAKKYRFTREEIDDFSAMSQQRAAHAADKGHFVREIVPVPIKKKGSDEDGWMIRDEGIRADTTAEKLSKLRTLHKTGVITAGNSSQISDGASAILFCNERGLQKLQVKPMAKVVSAQVVGSDPVIMLEGPVFATEKILAKTGMTIDQIDLYEVNEAFAPVAMACMSKNGMLHDRLNVNGGAVALGHPLGATGCRLTTTLLHELQRRDAHYGLVAICEGGGTANSLIIERLIDEKKPQKGFLQNLFSRM